MIEADNSNTKRPSRPCSVCGEEEVEILYTQRFAVYQSCSLPSSYDLVECKGCGFVYADTRATQSDYDKYYREFSKYEDDKTGTGGNGSGLDIKRMNETAEDIARVVKDERSSILDIGCANGGVLVSLKYLGYMELTGLDPSPVCVEKVKERGVGAILGGLFDVPKSLRSRKFDCVILSHVIEHIRDLSLAMKNIVNLLAKDGILYIEVPNAEKYCENFIVPYYYFDCEHINHFDLNSLKYLGLKYGLSFRKSVNKMIQVSDSSVYPAVGVFFQKKGKGSNYTAMSRAGKSILGYLRLSEQNADNVIINNLFKSKEKIVVWGAGQFTRRLLGDTKLGRCNIVAFIDNDSVKQGQRIDGVPIIDPSYLKDFTYPILICSALHSQEIFNEIRTWGFKNKVYLMSNIK